MRNQTVILFLAIMMGIHFGLASCGCGETEDDYYCKVDLSGETQKTLGNLSDVPNPAMKGIVLTGGTVAAVGFVAQSAVSETSETGSKEDVTSANVDLSVTSNVDKDISFVVSDTVLIPSVVDPDCSANIPLPQPYAGADRINETAGEPFELSGEPYSDFEVEELDLTWEVRERDTDTLVTEYGETLTPTITITNAGSYEIVFIVKDPCGTGKDTLLVTVTN